MKLILIPAVIVLLYLFLIMPSLRKCDRKRFEGRYYAHRGLHDNDTDHPENSLRAFEMAVERGYGMEFDVQLSKDNIPVIMHDMSAERALRRKDGTPLPGKVRDYTLEELRECTLFDSDEKIPTFREVLDLVDGKVPLIIEFKAEPSDRVLEVCPVSMEILKNYKGVYCVESFHPLVVYWFRKHYPELMRGQLSEEYGDHERKMSFIEFLCAYLLFNFLTKPDFIAYNHLHESNISRRLCRYLYHNFSVTYTIKSQEELDRNQGKFDIFIFDSFIPKEKD